MKTFEEVFQQMQVEEVDRLFPELESFRLEQLKSDKYQEYVQRVAKKTLMLAAICPEDTIELVFQAAISSVFSTGTLCGLRMNELNLEDLVK